MNLKAVLVDDESASRETLRNFLHKYCPEVEVIGEADAVPSALELLSNCKPDLVFLDVEMPFGNAFDLLEQLGDVSFSTVFVTAYDHYAIKALNFSASYYLLKPIDIDELIAAVEKVKKDRSISHDLPHAKILMENLKQNGMQQRQLVLPVLEGFEIVRIQDIIRCQANDNFTDFYFVNNKKLMICRTLKFYEDLLSDSGFMRIHKSHLINIQYVKKYIKGKYGTVIMSDNAEVDISPNKKEEFLSRFISS
ncbi:MAG: LytTR family DNA-binding domain-containing protein [Cytophagaceae bacterium]|jgi:two-component system LytT family response regulator|nr:LytTR family DNA-binding domain-containing protein [Cytophagaceae bacterium]